jgi:hypothetical protein
MERCLGFLSRPPSVLAMTTVCALLMAIVYLDPVAQLGTLSLLTASMLNIIAMASSGV